MLKYDNPFDGCLPTGVLPAAEVVVAFSFASGFVGVVEMVPPNVELLAADGGVVMVALADEALTAAVDGTAILCRMLFDLGLNISVACFQFDGRV